jgi:hypothetical protein
MRLANYLLAILAPVRYDGGLGPGAEALGSAIGVFNQATPRIERALELLLGFLGHDSPPTPQDLV